MNPNNNQQTNMLTETQWSFPNVPAVGNSCAEYEKIAAEWPQGEENTKTEAELVSLLTDAVYAINHYGHWQKWEEMRAWESRLQNAARAYPNSSKIQEALAWGTVYAMKHYGRNYDKLRKWGTLQTIAQAHPDNRSIQEALAVGAATAMWTLFCRGGCRPLLTRIYVTSL